MTHLAIYNENYSGATIISNRFIDEYMYDANDLQLKIYLYLIRKINANQSVSVSEIADKFNHTEKDVVRSFMYWEKQGLMFLDFDSRGDLRGIHMVNADTAQAPTVQMHRNRTPEGSLPLAVTSFPGAPTVSDSASRDVKTNIREFSKPSYSLDQLREFKQREEISQLLFVVESYIKENLSMSDMKTILFFKDVLQFSDDLIDYLIQYCVDRGKKDFKYIEKVAINWAERGITTPEEARTHSGKYDKNVYVIMNELGKSGSPTSREMEYINRWTGEYCFSMDIILEACQRTVLATDRHRFEYAEGILSSWYRENVHHKADIYRIDEMYQKKKTSGRQQPAAPNRFNQFKQNQYDFDALERDLLSN